MQRKTIVAVVCLLLCGCSYTGMRLAFPGVYRIDIPQGNIVTQDMVDQLEPGMTKRQVRFVMGTPLVIDTFAEERWDYIHSLEVKGHPRTQERVSLFFDKEQLVRIAGDMAPASANPAPATEPARANGGASH